MNDVQSKRKRTKKFLRILICEYENFCKAILCDGFILFIVSQNISEMCYNWRMNPSNDNDFGSFGAGSAPYGGMPGASGVSGGGVPGSSDAGGMFPNNQMQPISFGGGDIVLPPEAQGKTPKKGLIIGIMVGAVLLAVGLIVMVVINQGSKGGRELTVRERFNMLLNYVISGEESTADVTEEYSSDAKYYFNEQQKTMANREALYAKTTELLDNFMKAYDELGDKGSFSSDEGGFERIMESEEEIMDFARVVGAKKTPDVYNVVDIYKKEGAKTKQWFDKYYDYDAINDNVYLPEYKELFGKYISAQIERVKIYYDRGCVSGNTIRSNCVQDNNEIATKYNSLISELKGLWSGIKYYNDIGGFFTIRLFDANELLSNNTAFVMEVVDA